MQPGPRVPPLWENAFSSLKPLAAWTRDLVLRIEQVLHLFPLIKNCHPTLVYKLPLNPIFNLVRRVGRINEAATHFLAFRFYLPNRFPDRGSAILRTSKRGSGRLALLGVLGFHGRRFEHCERAARRGVHQGTLPRGSRVGQENCPAGRAKSYAAHNPHRKFL